MKKLCIVFIFFILILNKMSFAFKISELEFGKTLKKNEIVEKEFELINNENEDKFYRLSIKGDKNVEVIPKTIKLNIGKKQNFKVKVLGKNNYGEYQYFLVLEEMNKNKNNSVKILKKIEILQKYYIK